MDKLKSKVNYASNCKKAGQEIRDLIFECPILSGKDNIIPFTIDDNKLFMNKWVINKETKKLHIITICLDPGVIFLNSNNIEAYEDLLTDYEFENGDACGKIIKGKAVGCHSKINCKHYIPKRP